MLPGSLRIQKRRRKPSPSGPAEVIVEGQTSGEWVSLGNYTFASVTRAYVEISTPGEGTGSVVADVVLCVPNGQAE